MSVLTTASNQAREPDFEQPRDPDGTEHRSSTRNKFRLVLLSVIAVAAAVWFLRASYSVSMPFALGLVLAVILAPVRRAVADRMPPKLKWLGIASAVLTLLLVIGLMGQFVAFSLIQVQEQIPQYSELMDQGRNWARQNSLPWPDSFERLGQLAGASESGDGGQAEGSISIPQSAISYAMSAFSNATHALSLAVLAFFFMLLMLLESGQARERFGAAFGENRRRALQIVDAGAQMIREYLWVRTLVSLLSGALAAIWFLVIGVKLWYLWGFLFFALNYIPFVGSILAGIPPVLLGFATGGWTTGLLAAGGAIALENIIGNFLDPKLQGDRLSISPVVLLAALAFFGWVWSWPGIFLAVPLTVIAVVAMSRIPPLAPIALLLSNASNLDELQEATSLDSGD